MKTMIRRRGAKTRHVPFLALFAALMLALLLPAAGSNAAGDRNTAGEPVNTTAPTISGSATVGQTLTTTGGTWSSPTPLTRATYTWSRCDAGGSSCATIGSATKNHYTLVSSDTSHTIRVTQLVSNSAGSSSATSKPTSVVVNPTPVNKTVPKISGTPKIGQTLSTNGGTWTSSTSITAASYQWRRCDRSGNACSAIGGGGGSTYSLGNADALHTIRVAQTVRNASTSATAVSDPTAIVSAHGEPAYITLPKVAGSAQVGQRLSTTGAQWSSLTALRKATYQWELCDGAGAHCTDIAGGTDASYVIPAADVAHTLRVRQSVSNSAGTASATSAATALVGPANGTAVATAPPAIVGTVKVGSTLSTKGATWQSATAIASVAYQWQRCASNGSSCQPIPNAGSASYALTTADVGQRPRQADGRQRQRRCSLDFESDRRRYAGDEHGRRVGPERPTPEPARYLGCQVHTPLAALA